VSRPSPSGPAAPLGSVTVLRAGDDLAARITGHWLTELGARVHGPGTPLPAGPVDLLVGAAADVEASTGRADCVLSFSTPALGADGAPHPAVDERALWLRSGLGTLAVALDDPAVAPPAVPEHSPGSVLAGIAGCVAALAALVGRRSGAPAAGTIDVDKLEVLVALPMQPLAAAQLPEAQSPDAARAVANLAPRSVPAADGELFVGAVEPRQWRTLLEIVGLPELVETIGDAGEGLAEAEEALTKAITGWAATRSAAEAVEECQRRHVPVVAIRRPRDLPGDDHLRERGFFTRDDAGRPAIRLPWLSERRDPTPTGAGRAAVDRAATATPTAPLAGIRVLDLTWAWAGPFATTLLADLGAEVINIEGRPRPSNLRMQPPFAGHPGVDRGGWWSANQRGKLSVGVDLKSADGVRIVEELARISDVAVENFSPGVVDRLGIGPADLHRVNPRLVYASMSAFGQTGPATHYVGYGTQIQAASGAMFTSRPAAGQPWMASIPLADPVSGLAGAVAVLAHLLAAREDGGGAVIDVCELEAMCWPIVEALVGDAAPEQAPEPAPPAARPADVLRDRWLDQRGFWIPDMATAMTRTDVKIAAPMWTLDGERPAVARGAPDLFGDTDEVLSRLLGYTPDRLRQLHDAGAVR
jgi:crotonobetainyl-CoA:carnitine CoA-transferase CaiB-like acyl-CoA transferase